MSLGRRNVIALAIGALSLAAPPIATAQTADRSSEARASVERSVREADTTFWSAFDTCDANAMAARFTDDAEFYHDITGLTTTRAGVTASMTAGPCADRSKKHLRREAIAGTSRYDMLAGGYALLSGQHRFYAVTDGRPERHDSVARYIELWQQSPAGWRMRRIVSYDHQPDVPNLIAVPVPARTLAGYLGSYRSADGSAMLVSRGDHGLELASGPARFPLVPLGNGTFGTIGRWLTFRFDKDGIEVAEEGRVVATASRHAKLP